jgi:5-hydroxyisourate hydrolase
MSAISTHVLDTVMGKPASGVGLSLWKRVDGRWTAVTDGITDGDGRCRDLVAEAERGTYRLTFATGEYFYRHGRMALYSEITVVFECDGDAHYHLPLLLSDNCFTTYRGS